MRPKVLLVYANPAVTATPVTPYGMERIAQVMELAGCEVELLAPWIEADPLARLQRALAGGDPALVGFSVRNIDDALVVRGADGDGDIDTTFYLDAVRPLVAAALEAVGPARVVLGGAALATGGPAVARYLGATIALAGPAEDLAFGMARQLVAGQRPALPEDPRVLHGAPAPARWETRWRAPPGPTPRLGPYLGLAVARGGRVPVQLSAGCDRRCSFCVEARFLGGAVALRPVDAIVAEIEALTRLGIRRFWLAASELNVPSQAHAIALLRRLAGRGLDLRGFLQVAPISDDLLDAMEDAGMDPQALSFELGHLDDAVLRAGGGPANRRQLDQLVETWLRRGYRQLGGSVLFGAHPAETEATLGRAVDAALAIDRALPDGLGLAYACGARVYAAAPLADWIRAHPAEAAPHLYARAGDTVDPEWVRPVVFSRPGAPRTLLAQLSQALAGSKGGMGPMNAEAPADPGQLAAEACVNRGIWRLQEERPAAAAACFRQALGHAPAHLEALSQLAQVAGNQLGCADEARGALTALLAALPAGDARRGEVQRALAALKDSR